uniref:zinc ribbon domain-containing protein n=1 Tax=Methanohalobium sp. TaxID=2837493 RepID=UPI0025F92E5A
FVQKLEYKAEWYGKNIIKIGQFDPSSKICHVCGYYHQDLELKDREWECSDCKTTHDRDINASVNIKKFALDRQNLLGIKSPSG